MNGIVAEVDKSDINPSAAGSRCWYVVRCKPRQELVAQENLTRQGFGVYLPQIEARQRRGDRWIVLVQPLFPRYLFVQVERGQQSTASIRSTRGAVGLVRFGGEPAVVPSRVMASIIDREDAITGFHVDARPSYRAGEAVRMLEGPFAGMEGIFASDDGDKRAVLLIELLGKANQVSVDRDWIIRAT